MGSRRVRERLEAVEIPLKRTKKSQKARHLFFTDSMSIETYPWGPKHSPLQV